MACDRRTASRLLAAILLVLFLGYRGATTLFMHTHVLDGVVFTHSHPGNGSTHHHTVMQLQALSMLSNFETGDPADPDTELSAEIGRKVQWSVVLPGSPAVGCAMRIAPRGPPFALI